MAQLKGKYIEDLAVTAAKLAAEAVETAKIKDLNVTAGKLAANAVETAKIKDLNVTEGKLAAKAVTLAKQADIATASIMGRKTAGSGEQEVLSKSDALTLLNVEDGADVTDEANVTDALDGATLVAATVAVDDKVLIQDTNGSDVLKTVTVQSIVDLAASANETKIVEIITLDATDISNKFSDDMTQVPITAAAVEVIPVGGIPQEYTVDFTVITDGSDINRLNWDGLGLEALLESADKIMVSYTY